MYIYTKQNQKNDVFMLWDKLNLFAKNW